MRLTGWFAFFGVVLFQLVKHDNPMFIWFLDYAEFPISDDRPPESCGCAAAGGAHLAAGKHFIWRGDWFICAAFLQR